MSLQRMLTDNAFIENKNGERTGPFKTKFGPEKLVIFNEQLVVTENDVVIQPLPNGTEERFAITDVQFNSGIGRMQSHFSITVVKEAKQERENKVANNTTFHINNSNVQVGDGNIQNIVNAFEQLTQEIESSNSTPAEKEEAKGLLKSLISNPTVASVLGGAVSGLIGVM
ncbi:hypothetical protein [Psychromonas sp. psych-6C06]|uniref:hypothetical protein n=1 Tax=Psychromonas sp. psych-6C06 TaxID=2058089 RepID=UPI00128FF568|nr:hypothetical protein [Psychromonas sp. psych-6C06]